MLSDTAIGISELLERADFHALLVYHTLQRRNNDHSSHGKCQNGKDKRKPVEHLHITACCRDVTVCPGRYNQRRRYNLFNGILNCTRLSSVLQFDQNRGIRQGRYGTVIQENKAVMIRIRNGFFGCNRIFSGKNRTSNREPKTLTGNQKRDGISRQ